MTPEETIVLAIQAAGPNASSSEWRRRIAGNVVDISLMLKDGSDMMKLAAEMGDLKPIATYVDRVEFEERSKRWRIFFAHQDGSPQMSARKQDEQEAIRTDRTDDPLFGKRADVTGKALRKGTHILVWKVLETMGNGDKVRVARHIDILSAGSQSPGGEQKEAGRRSAGSHGADVAPTPPGDDAAPAGPPPSPAAAEFDPMVLARAAEAKLTEHQFETALRAIQGAGFAIIDIQSRAEWDDKIAPHLRKAATQVPADEEPF